MRPPPAGLPSQPRVHAVALAPRYVGELLGGLGYARDHAADSPLTLDASASFAPNLPPTAAPPLHCAWRCAAGPPGGEAPCVSAAGVALSLPSTVGVTLQPDAAALFAACTHVSLHCGLTAETRGLVNAEMIGRILAA